jgi:predicted acylesterase/phospholipase RssA
VIRSLVTGEPFDIFCGTSIGAINAAMAAQGDVDGLAGLWHDMASTSVVRLTPRVAALQRALGSLMAFAHAPIQQRGIELLHVASAITKIGGLDAIFETNALFDPEPIADYLKRHLDFSALEKTLIVTATDLAAGRPTAFFAFAGPLAET